MTPVDADKVIRASRDAGVTGNEASRVAEALYAIRASAERLDGEYDDNFLLTASDARYVLKISHPAEKRSLLEMQIAAQQHVAGKPMAPAVPTPIESSDGRIIAELDVGGTRRFVRLLRFIPGTLLARSGFQSAAMLRSLGRSLAELDRALSDFDHPAAHRDLQWDIGRAASLRPETAAIEEPERRALVSRILDLAAVEVLPVLPQLRRSVIHGDGNDYNVLVDDDRVVGLLDFGDMVHAATISELAIAAAYAMAGKSDPLGAAAHVVAGYNRVLPLTETERRVLFPMMLARLAMSVIISASRRRKAPGEAYYTVHETAAWSVLEQVGDLEWDIAAHTLTSASADPADVSDLRAIRERVLGRNLSLSYEKPLHIVRGWRQYLYDSDGREYLDAYNNVPHVGHSHPKVVAAVARQMAVLNTNTRYLHENVLRCAERLGALLPAPLRVCYFVNSGSEANELALRMARAHTGATDIIVSEGAYHGNTRSLIDASPYKYDGPGGGGRPRHVHAVPVPDTYRGQYRADDPSAGARYASHVSSAIAAIQEAGRGVSAFIIESLLSAGGQIVLPQGYLANAFAAVRAAGGVCVVDEVQVGFGRVGSRFWGFELQDVVPDIVVMGKPMGNGHPIGAVVTTPAIAASFDNGMEYFNTFGGNPVSMAAALAVLDVIEEEGLQAHALRAGNALLAGLRDLQSRHDLVGDARGVGLFVGIEVVRNRATLEAAPAEAMELVNRLKEQGILAGTEGPYRNVIKIKPPLVFDEANAARLVETLDGLLRAT